MVKKITRNKKWKWVAKPIKFSHLYPVKIVWGLVRQSDNDISDIVFQSKKEAQIYHKKLSSVLVKQWPTEGGKKVISKLVKMYRVCSISMRVLK